MLPPSWTDTWGENRSHELVGICSSILLAYAAGLAAMMGQALTTEMGQEFLVPRSTRRVWYLGLTALLSVMAVVALNWPAWRSQAGLVDPFRVATHHSKTVTLSAILLSATMALGTSALVLGTFPNSGDEYAYIFQAQTYSSGRLWNDPPPLGQALASTFTYVVGGKWVSQYPPGWPALLAVADTVGFPLWAVNVVIGTASSVLIGRIARREGGPLAETITVPLYALSPFYIFNAASYHSHVVVALLGLVCTDLALKLQDEGRSCHAVALGVTIGLIGMTRYVSALWLGLALAIALCARPFSSQPRALARIALGVLPFVLTILVYHWALTGDPLKPVYWAGGRDADRLYIDLPSLAHGLFLTEWRLLELAEWTSPLLLVGYGTALAWKLACRSLRFYDLVFVVFALGFVLYPLDGGNRYGPRYYFDAFPCFVLTIGTAAASLVSAHGGVRIKALVVSVATLTVVHGITTYPFLAAHNNIVVAERRDVFRRVAHAGLHHAVILVTSGTGVRWYMTIESLARNGIGADADILYARGDLVTADDVRGALPDRAVWIYAREDGKADGELYLAP